MPKKIVVAQITDEDAILQLINTYTARKDWFMVERLFNDLGKLYTEEEAA